MHLASQSQETPSFSQTGGWLLNRLSKLRLKPMTDQPAHRMDCARNYFSTCAQDEDPDTRIVSGALVVLVRPTQRSIRKAFLER